MPDRRLAKARASLPEGYQFGDARAACEHDWRCRESRWLQGGYQAICAKCGHDAGAVELSGIQAIYGVGFRNVIEGEPFSTDRDPGDETTPFEDYYAAYVARHTWPAGKSFATFAREIWDYLQIRTASDLSDETTPRRLRRRES